MRSKSKQTNFSGFKTCKKPVVIIAPRGVCTCVVDPHPKDNLPECGIAI